MILDFKIIYSEFVPDERIKDFTDDLHRQIDTEIQVVKDTREYENFTGPDFSDIAIYIKENLTGIILSGIIVNAAYSVIKYSLTKLWRGFSSLVRKDGQDRGSGLAITVNLEDADRDTEITFQGNIKENDLEKITEKLFEFLGSKQLPETLKNPHYIQDSDEIPRIRLIYNEETKNWEPLDFRDLKKNGTTLGTG